MNRKNKILKSIDENGLGLEIGPSHSPIAPKKSGYNVEVIDYLCQEDLIKKYSSFGETPEADICNIEEVDYVWQGEDYSELTGKTKYYDWVIASHVIEHVPDLVNFINSCDAILKEGGALSLAIPDRRYCFDYFRPITGLSKILDSHFASLTKPSLGTVAEYYMNIVTMNGEIAWGNSRQGEFAFSYTRDEALQKIKFASTGEYMDTHQWCFVPHSFRMLINDLFNLGFIKLREFDFMPTAGCEFYVVLSRNGTGPNMSRLDLAKEMDRELRNPFIPSYVSIAKRVRRFIYKVPSFLGDKML